MIGGYQSVYKWVNEYILKVDSNSAGTCNGAGMIQDPYGRLMV